LAGGGCRYHAAAFIVPAVRACCIILSNSKLSDKRDIRMVRELLQATILKPSSFPPGSVENRHRDERQTGIYPIPGFVGYHSRAVRWDISEGRPAENIRTQCYDVQQRNTRKGSSDCFRDVTVEHEKMVIRLFLRCDGGTRENGHQTVFECPETAGC